MPVSDQHPDYKANIERWGLVRDVIANDAQERILVPKHRDKDDRWAYKNRAVLTNFTSLTKDGLTGLVFRLNPDIELPTELEYLKEDATGDGRGLAMLAKQSLGGEIMPTGRVGLLADYPRRTGGTSVRDTEELKARILLYRSESIINWNVERINNRAVIKYIVLFEPTLEQVEDDEFAWELKDKYRLLKLDEDGNYFQALYDENLDIVDFVYPLDKNGNNFTEIPFTFIGAEDNNEEIDKPPLYDLSVLNIAHYRNSADYEESVYKVGQPQLVLGSDDISLDAFMEAAPNGIKTGVQHGLFLGSGAFAQLIQANPNQLAAEAMKNKREDAAHLGARLVAKPGGRETAEGVKVRFSAQNSSLHTMINNIDAGIKKAIVFCSMFMGGSAESIEFTLNRQFYEELADPQLVLAMIQAFQSGMVTLEEARIDWKQKSILNPDKTEEEFKEEMLNQDPFVNAPEETNANNTEQTN